VFYYNYLRPHMGIGGKTPAQAAKTGYPYESWGDIVRSQMPKAELTTEDKERYRVGLSYNLRLIPKPLTIIRYRRIRDIPGSKTLLIAMAWGIVTAVLPPLSVFGQFTWITILLFLWSAGIVFVRTAFFDILDMQGDRIVGKETIPILLGEKRSMRLLYIMLSGLIAILALSGAFQLVSSLGWVLMLCPIFMWIIISAYERGLMLPSIKLEFLVESNFILAAILSFVWTLMGL